MADAYTLEHTCLACTCMLESRKLALFGTHVVALFTAGQ